MPELMTKQDAIEYLLYMKHDVQAKSHMDIALDTAIEALKQLTIEAEPIRRGRWIFGSSNSTSWMKCSICCKSQSGQTATFSYCPNCGARMDLRTPTEVGLDIADSVMIGGAENG